MTQIEKSLRDMYELGKKHGYQEAEKDLKTNQLINYLLKELKDKSSE
jgi:hypothetical protein